MDGHMRDSSSYRSSALDARRLSLFLAVVDHGGFSRAAQAVHISQPALSQAIAELESELGGPLFHRLARSVTLTDAGAALVGPARSVLRDPRRGSPGRRGGHGSGQRTSRLVRASDSGRGPLLGAAGSVRAHPAIVVRIASRRSGRVVDHIRSGAAEVAITDGDHVPPGLVSIPLSSQTLQIVFPPGTALPVGPLRPDQLAEVPLIVTPVGTSGRALLDELLHGHGLDAKVTIETSQREALLPLVLAGAGASFMPEALAAIAAKAGAVVAAVEPPLVRSWWCTVRGP